MAASNKTDSTEHTNEKLSAENERLKLLLAEMDSRMERMEALISEAEERGTPFVPEPELLFDPFDAEVNPHHIHTHPDGKRLNWINPYLRTQGGIGMRGWVPVEYDDEIGKNLSKYINDPPNKMLGSSQVDNYVRRGTDTVLCSIDEETYLARQQSRERKALRKQAVAQSSNNAILRPGVTTFGDGVQTEQAPSGGFRPGNRRPSPNSSTHHSTEMFGSSEE